MYDKRSFPVVCTILLGYSKGNEVFECIECLLQQKHIRNKILFVANGADANSTEKIREIYPSVLVIDNGKNEGAAGGRNLGIAAAFSEKPDYVYFVDNDALIEDDAIWQLVKASRSDPSAGFLSSVFYEKGNRERVFSAGVYLKEPLGSWILREVRGELIKVDFAGTGSMLVPVETLKRVGFFDEGLVVYHEDTDLCLRGRMVGLSTVVVSASRAYHDAERRDNLARVYYGFRNELLVRKKNGLIRSFLESRVLLYMLRSVMKTLFSSQSLAFTKSLVIVRAFGDALCGKSGFAPEKLYRDPESYREVKVRQQLYNSNIWKIQRKLRRMLGYR